MDSLVCAMSVITPSEMMSRIKYCEPSVTADAYLAWSETRGHMSKIKDSSRQKESLRFS